MKVLGVTGSIGMGKSLVCHMLRYQGFPVKDADAVVHELLRSNQEVIRMIAGRFPEVVKFGSVERQRLAQRVVSDREVLHWLEGLLHPLVRKTFDTFIGYHKRRGRWLVVLEIPLLFETSMETYCDAILVVTAARFIQEARTLSRPNMTPEHLDILLQAQFNDRIKRRKADFVFLTGCSKAETWHRTRYLIQRLKSSSLTLRRGRRVSYSFLKS